MLYKCIKVLARVVVGVWFFLRFKVVGAENIPKEGAFLLACKHRSNWDPILMAVRLPRRIGFLGKIEIARVPLLGKFALALGMIPIDRGKSPVAAIETVASALRGGKPVMIFPEEHRTKQDQVDEVKGGIGVMIKSVGVPVVVVPCAIVYRTWGVVPRRVVVVYGTPSLVDYAGLEGTDKQKRQMICSEIQYELNRMIFAHN